METTNNKQQTSKQTAEQKAELLKQEIAELRLSLIGKGIENDLIGSYILLHLKYRFASILLHWRGRDINGDFTPVLYQIMLAKMLGVSVDKVLETVLILHNKGLINIDTNLKQGFKLADMIEANSQWQQKVAYPQTYKCDLYFRILPAGTTKKQTIYTPEYLQSTWGIAGLSD